MPWEKTFDVEKAIENAMLLFWHQGYTDSSMAAILSATKLTKGSFYNAFGSKQNLFIQALKKYGQGRRERIQHLIEQDSPKQAIEDFFHGLVAETVQDHHKKGCFMINTLLNLESYEQEIQRVVKTGIANSETFFKQMIELGQMRGEIATTLRADELACFFVGTMVSIRVLGRGFYDKTALQLIANQALLRLQ
ncbi:TetR/AcrR family transcriptional regulator [Marinomonas agarivorans]|nr:TetR/AcrR family transcriptional regulator [Marinomonas agarivorans]